MAKHLHTFDEFKTAVASLCIVDFHATWCGPCKTIAPLYNTLATKHPTVPFYKVDVDEVQAATQAAGVSAMPTFQVWTQGSVVAEIKGANPDALTKLVSVATKLSYTNAANTEDQEDQDESKDEQVEGE